MTGQVFGNFTVENFVTQTVYGTNKWKCKCVCGNTKIVTEKALISGSIKSCGCKTYLDEKIGNKYYLLTVIGKAENSSNGWKQSLCRCKCGNKVIVSNISLRAGMVKSCGCLISYGENVIEDIFKEKNINYKRQYSFNDLRGPKNGLLKFDFAVLKDNGNLQYLIEYQGCQHDHEIHGNPEYGRMQREITDDMKRKYCKENDIHYYEVWYDKDIHTEMNRIFEIERNPYKETY